MNNATGSQPPGAVCVDGVAASKLAHEVGVLIRGIHARELESKSTVLANPVTIKVVNRGVRLQTRYRTQPVDVGIAHPTRRPLCNSSRCCIIGDNASTPASTVIA